MAAANPSKALQDEMSCPICLDYFNDPVSLDCDHNYCRACITQFWEGSQTVSCPQCRQTFLQRNGKPNRQLKNIVEAARGLRFQSVRGAQTEGLCKKHKEPLKLFCKEDDIPICVVCDRSKEHRDHMVIPAEEAAEEFKEKIQGHLKILNKERDKLLKFKASRLKINQENLRKIQTERQKTVSEFQQLRKFLEEQEGHLLAQLEKLDQEMVKIQTENITKLSREISRVSELISELEGKYQKAANEFLQDVRSTLSRCEKWTFQQLEEISPELDNRLKDFSQKTVVLMENLRKFKDTLSPALETKRKTYPESFTQPEFTESVTLDPDTAHPLLVLSEGGKSVKLRDTPQDLPNNPERFDSVPCVLGHEGFTSGRHWWEVEVGDRGDWAVGVARESVRRKGEISPSPAEGIWAVERMGDLFQTFTSSVTPLSLGQVPSRIRVFLDRDQGQVTFFNVGDEAPIFTFPLGSLHRERIHPWLWVEEGSQLRLWP